MALDFDSLRSLTLPVIQRELDLDPDDDHFAADIEYYMRQNYQYISSMAVVHNYSELYTAQLTPGQNTFSFPISNARFLDCVKVDIDGKRTVVKYKSSPGGTCCGSCDSYCCPNPIADISLREGIYTISINVPQHVKTANISVYGYEGSEDFDSFERLFTVGVLRDVNRFVIKDLPTSSIYEQEYQKYLHRLNMTSLYTTSNKLTPPKQRWGYCV